MNRKLWDISADLEAVGDALAENGGELTPELEAALDALGGEFDVKVESIALFALDLESMADAATEEAKRLSALAKVRIATAKRLKDYLVDAMQRAQRAKVETPRAKVWWQRNGQPAVKLPAELSVLVPLDCAREVPRIDVQVDRAAILAAWDDDAKRPALVAAGVVVDRGASLRIK